MLLTSPTSPICDQDDHQLVEQYAPYQCLINQYLHHMVSAHISQERNIILRACVTKRMAVITFLIGTRIMCTVYKTPRLSGCCVTGYCLVR